MKPAMTAIMAALALVGGFTSAGARAAEPKAPTLSPFVLSWTSEQQAYGYRHMEEIQPAATVNRGNHVRELPLAAKPIDASFAWAGKSYNVDAYMRAWNVSGLIVIKDGRVVLERYGLGRTANERWTSFSVAKSITSTLIGAAIRDGKIKNLNDPVSLYIPQLVGSAYDSVTIRQLLTMTSGVKWNEDYSDPNSDVAKVGLTAPEPGINPVVSYMRALPREAPAGTKFVYKTGETDLAGILLSNAVGEPMAKYLSRKIWTPFGMEQNALWTEDSAGHERGGCCINMTLRDYARFGLFMLEGGKAAGKDVLPDGWINDATRAHVTAPPYGYFWWLGPGVYRAEGIFGQTITVIPREHMVIAINSAWASADKDEDWGAMVAFQQALVEASRKK